MPQVLASVVLYQVVDDQAGPQATCPKEKFEIRIINIKLKKILNKQINLKLQCVTINIQQI